MRGVGRFTRLAGWLAAAVLLSQAASRAGGPDAAFMQALRADLAGATQALAESRLELAAEGFAGVIDRARTLKAPNLPLARGVDGLADARRLQGRIADAAGLYEEAAEMWAELLGEVQPRRATTLHNLGVVLAELGRTDDAVRALGHALEIWNAVYGTDAAETRNTERLLERLSR